MIDKEQPTWVNFHNLDTENLNEIKEFVDLYYPFYAEGLQRGIKNCQILYRKKQKEIQWLVNLWLKIVKPALKKPRKLEKPGEINIEERAIQGFIMWLNQKHNSNSRWNIIVNNANKLEREYFEDPNSADLWGAPRSFAEFIEVVLEDSYHKVSKIKKCKRKGCENIFLKLGTPESRNKHYCSDGCFEKAKPENNREYIRQSVKPTNQTLCDLIESWLKLSNDEKWLKKVAENEGMPVSELSEIKKDLKGEREWIKAKDLAQILDSIVEYGVGNYNNVEITFLNARTLGKKLSPAKKELMEESLIAEELRQRGILIEIEKKGAMNHYRFIRTQSSEVAPDADTNEKDDMMKILRIPPEILEAENEPHYYPYFDTKIAEKLLKQAKPPILVGYLVDEE